MWRNDFRREVAAVGLVVILAAALSLPRWYQAVTWTPDGLFYAAQTLQLRGQTETQSLKVVFDGREGRTLRSTTARSRSSAEHIADGNWVRHSATFYRRRWLVPMLAAALYPLMGLRSVELVSLLGYVLAGLFIFLLLRRRFSVQVAVIASAVCLLLPTFRTWSFLPLTDSWGVALEAASLTAAIAVIRRGLAFLPLWVISIAALSVTRDVGLAIVLAVGYVAICRRTMRHCLMFVSGLAAALPAPLLLGAPLKDQLNWALSGYRVIHPASWRGVLHHYIPSLHSTVVLDLRTELPTVLLFLMAFVALWASRRTHDEYLQLIRASTAFSIAYLAIVPVYTGFRLELALLPMVAVGVGLPLATLPWQFVRISRADAVVPARRR